MKKFIDQWLDENQRTFIDISDKIWELAEMRFRETGSAKMIIDLLQKEGFAVESGIADIETAFVGSYGTGKPVIAFLGEYDALAGLSQVACSATKSPLVSGGTGHGCGHNMLGAGALAAAVAAKRAMEKQGLGGTIRFYGCPGEEGGSGKAFMARAGVFDDVDSAITWHPFGNNAVMSVAMLANFQIAYRFHGRSAHAAASPHLGRSALDAVELMNVGVNYLREHVIQEARMHYAITETGGKSPNVVQAEAEVLYLIRAPLLQQVSEIYERICNIARGAALMTETTLEIIFDKACSNVIPNNAIEEVMYANFLEVGTPKFDEADYKLAQAIRETLSPNDIASDLSMAKIFMGANKGLDILEQLPQKPISETILPYSFSTALLPGSSDVGDVSWITPTAQIAVACQAFGTPAHSWQAVSQGKSGMAHKGLITAAKVMARTAVDLLANPEITDKAKTELNRTLGGIRYTSPMPPEVKHKPFMK